MSTPLLLTTFAPWKAHQVSNASEDLIVQLERSHRLPANALLLRRIPVSFDLAPAQVIAEMVSTGATYVVCCGMAEGRQYLNLERYARRSGRQLQTGLDLEALLAGTVLTRISMDAGSYVCNHLYFEVLAFMQQCHWPGEALFVHVPCLNSANLDWLVDDLARILKKLSNSHRFIGYPFKLGQSLRSQESEASIASDF